jgi:hypothetical protein
MTNNSAGDGSPTNMAGKRYRCEVCDSEVICVRPGSGRVQCHDSAMTLLAPKPLPATD